MLGLTLDQWLEVAQSVALIGGGLWALYLYASTRKNQVRIKIEPTVRVMKGFAPGKALLLVRLRLSNSSEVLYRSERACVTLFEARELTVAGGIRLRHLAEADPLLPVYGRRVEDPARVEAGQAFEYAPDQQILLEPGEHADTELPFAVDSDQLGLMVVQVALRGRQRTRGRKVFDWGTFFYVDANNATVPVPLAQDPPSAPS